MNAVVPHGIAHGLVDQSMPGDPTMRDEVRADDADVEMAAACLRTRMATVQMAVIPNRDGYDLQATRQTLADHRGSIVGRLVGHGMTRRNGLTCTEA